MTLLPHTARIRGENKRRPRDPPAQPGERPGALGAIHPGLPAASLQKSARQANHGRQATNPFGVFHSPPSLLAPGWKKEGARRRRTAPGKEGAGNEEPGARSREQGPELRERITGVDNYTTGTPSTRQGRCRAYSPGTHARKEE
jgi:hypothetical protein